MDNLPLVSVLMPTYNREKFVGEAIESVLSQTYPNFELLVVDDGSTDKTKSVVQKYLTDPRVKYFYKENGGQSSGRNLGFKNSKGDYIAFLDSDNKWKPEKLKICMTAALDNPDVGVVYGDNITIDEHGNEIGRDTMRRHSGFITAQLLKDNFVTINTATLKRECYEAMGGLDESFIRAPDYEFWLRLSTRYKFLYVPQYVSYYRVMEDQISSDKDGRFKANYEILQHFLTHFSDSVSRKERRLGMSYFYCRKARYEASKGRKGKAIRDCIKAAIEYPFWLGPFRAFYRVFIK